MSAPAPSPLHDLVERLHEIEQRLARLLVSGWRNAAPEAADLEEAAAALDGGGLSEGAARLRAVAGATTAEEALRAITLASSACRLLRARLAADLVPQGQWRPLLEQGSAVQTDRLIPLARFALPDGEAWSCLRLRGAFSAEWLLVEPPPVAPGWLHRPLQGQLHWLRRYPLGTAGEVQLCRLLYAAPTPGFAPGQDPLDPFRQTLDAGRLTDDAWLLGGAGVLRARRFDAAALAEYDWPDSGLPDALGPSRNERWWSLVWVQGEIATPVAVVTAAGLVVHLVSGWPTELSRVSG